MSLDGYAAGPDQDLVNPLGVGGTALHEWFFPTRTFQKMHGSGDAGTTGVDDLFAARGFDNVGAWIMGRNMFGPVRGPWLNEAWRGWWGDYPPYHTQVFVLTHYPRPSVTMEGETVFHFVTDGIEDALLRAKVAAKGRDIRIGGGASTVRQYLSAGLIDEMHIALSPTLLGTGEPLFAGINVAALGYRCSEHVGTANATHIVMTKDFQSGTLPLNSYYATLIRGKLTCCKMR